MDHRPTLSLLLLLLGLSQASGNEIHDELDHVSITSTILVSNNGTNELLLEGDILAPRTRNAMKCFSSQYSCLWRKSIDGLVYVPYILSNVYSSLEVETIETSMKYFHGKTCIRFIPRRRQTAYLDIQSSGGCFSSMGTVGDRQTLSLAQFGCVQHGIIQHELLHSLGFHHEHNRSDRDQYIRINWQYIYNYAIDNFQKQDTNNLNTAYDYSSVMHYDRTAFTNNYGKETITPVPDPSVAIGQRQGMSDIDVLRVNKLYQC
ncbi:low choriolytic enzyme-like [Oncorhynchus clarkii lewisi]|uniref:low choriolytic enzyme-like n=1 Tax=Oncorhynchus clarkii lewisi TaxID=490388 RepID=UPI0039B83902